MKVLDGIIVVNKGKNCTSHDVVYKVKKLFGEKVGHTGTLDPNATGVLPILIGKGTGVSKYLINHDKKYIATIQLGVKTETADVEGDAVEERDVDVAKLNKENINQIFVSLIGKQMQKPPIYSAIKVKGKKLYEYARSGKSVEIPEREIEIYGLELLNINQEEKTLQFEIHCSKGTYIRSVCELIAEKLDTVGFMLELKRTLVGDFVIEKSVSIEELQENVNNEEFLKKNVITLEKFFADKSEIVLNDKNLNLFLNGVNLTIEVNDDIVRVYNENKDFIGVATNVNGKIKRDIIVLE